MSFASVQDLHRQGNEAEAELCAWVGFVRARDMLADPAAVFRNARVCSPPGFVPQHSEHETHALYLLTVICNRRAEMRRDEAATRRRGDWPAAWTYTGEL